MVAGSPSEAAETVLWSCAGPSQVQEGGGSVAVLWCESS